MSILHDCSMRWDDLRILLAVSRSGSLTEAAGTLDLDPTTVSRRLDAFEEGSGAVLVTRDRGGPKLTSAGERVARAAEQVELIMLDLEREVLGEDTQLRGSLRVTTTDMFAQHHAELFHSFGDRYPEIALELGTTYANRSLARREADVALRFGDRPDPQLFGRKLVRFAYAPYASRGLVERIGRRAALARYPFLAWDPGTGARRTERWIRKHAPGAAIACRFDSSIAMHAAAAAGQGVAVMPCIYGDDGQLVRLRPPPPELGYDLWVLTHPDLRRTARVRAFLEHAAAYVEARRTAFEGRARRPG